MIVCPPHLVQKWVREIKNTIPGAKAEVVTNALEMQAAVARALAHERAWCQRLGLPKDYDLSKRTGSQALPGYYIVVSRERLKRGYGFRPAANLEIRPQTFGHISNQKRWCCPRCGKPVGYTEEEEVLTAQEDAVERASNQTEIEAVTEAVRAVLNIGSSRRSHRKGKKGKGKGKGKKKAGSGGDSPDAQEGWKGLSPLPANRKTYCDNVVRTWIPLPTAERPLAGKWTSDPEQGARLCGEPLWQSRSRLMGEPLFLSPTERASGVLTNVWSVGPRTISISRFITRDSEMLRFWKKGTFLVDEVHEYKAEDSAQGVEIGRLCRLFKRAVAMTGTICGGKASSLFFLLWRFLPQVRQQFAINELSRWIDHYGIWEKTEINKSSSSDGDGDDEIVENGAISDRRSYNREKPREKPGLRSSVLLQMLPNTIFLKLADVSRDLPPYREHVKLFDMDGAELRGQQPISLTTLLSNGGGRGASSSDWLATQAGQYHQLDTALRQAAADALVKGSQRLLGALVQSLLAYPDMPYNQEKVYDPLDGSLVAHAMALPKDKLYPKERALVELYQQERARGRKVLLFVSNTKRRDITPRLKWVLEKHTAARVSVLKSGTPEASKREEWVQDRLREGFDLLEVHPRCVQTGLDLLDFPTIIFYQIEYSTQVMRQASRRSWRIGQKCPVDVYYFGYRLTAQEQALRLMAKKVRAALSLEGDLDNDGLVGLADEDEDENDSLYALATALLEAGKEQPAGAAGAGEEAELGSLEEIFNSLHAQEMEAARFVLENARLIGRGGGSSDYSGVCRCVVFIAVVS